MAEPSGGDRSSRSWLFAALAAALGLRVFWMIFARPVPVSDYENFRVLAQGLLAHHQFGWPAPTAYRFPGYPAALALAMLLSPSVSWLRLFTVLLSAALTPAAYALGKRLASGDERYGLAAAWVCALNPTFVFWSPILASEHLFTLLVFLGLALVARPGGPKPRDLLLGGVCLGCAVLTRGEGLLHVPAFLLAMGLATPRATLGRRLKDAAVFLLPVALLAGGWTARNIAVVGWGSGVSTSGGINFYMAHGLPAYGYQGEASDSFAGLSEPEASAAAYRAAFAELRRRPQRLPRDVAIGTWEQFRPGAYGVSWSARLPRNGSGIYPEKHLAGRRFFAWVQVLGYAALCLLTLGSLWFVRRIPLGAWAVPLALLFFNWICYAVIFFANSRYRYLGEAGMCLLAASGIAAWWPRPERSGLSGAAGTPVASKRR